MLSAADPLGHTSSYTYDPGFGQLISSTDARGNSSTNYYDDTTGNLMGTKDALGHVTTNFYDPSGSGLLTGSRDALGNLTTNTYDGSGNLVGTALIEAGTGRILSTNSATFDDNGNRITSTVWRHVAGGGDWAGATTTYVYDGQNRVVQTINPDGGTNTIVYDATGKQSETIDPLEHATSYVYDNQGRLVQTTFPDLTTTSSAYDSNGNRTNSVDQLGRVTSYVYDAINRLAETVYPDGATNGTVYDDLGRVRFSIDARGTTNAFGYDAAGRRVAVTNALGVTGIQMTNGFLSDENGNQVVAIDGLGHGTTNVYDALNRQVEMDYADGTKTFTGYDANGQRVAETNQDSVVTRFGYDGAGRLVSVTNAFGKAEHTETTYAYDEAGNQTNQVDALGRETRFEFDGMGRRIKRILPGGQTESFGYDLAGNQLLRTNFNGVVITNLYDAMNRLTNRASTNGYAVSFAYSATGQRTNMVDPSGTTAYAYDARDRLTNKVVNWNGSVPLSVTLNYGYDVGGNVTNLWSSTPDGVTNFYEYDALNRLTNVLGRDGVSAAYTFDGIGNQEALQLGNGVTNVCQYDRLNRLTNMVWKLTDSTVASFYYQLGQTGNRTNLSETVNGSRFYAWKYDSLYRLTNETLSGSSPTGATGYGLDHVGNRTNRTSSVSGVGNQSFTFNTNDWLSTDQYDRNGNTTNSAGNFYQYDPLDHLTNLNSGSITITYDGDGNRMSKTVGTTTTFYLVDDRNLTGYPQVLEEYESVGGGDPALTAVYSYGLALIAQKRSGSVSYFVHDGHGSIRALTDSDGTVSDTYIYDAFGVLIGRTGTSPNNYLYCGEQYDWDLGLYYNRARYLNAGDGRFWTMDSSDGNNQDPVSLHKYLFTADNPVNMLDPTGNWATFIHRMAIDATLKGLLSDADIEILRQMQDEVDRKENQTAERSFMHAMRDGETNETPEHAKGAANKRIRDLLTDARSLEASGDHKQAMEQLGRAMHTLQDSTSPAHHGFQPWYDYACGKWNPHEWVHGAAESIYPGTGSSLETATLRMYNYFKGTESMPTDFFAHLPADGVLEGVKEKIRRFRIPTFNFWLDGGDGGGIGAGF